MASFPSEAAARHLERSGFERVYEDLEAGSSSDTFFMLRDRRHWDLFGSRVRWVVIAVDLERYVTADDIVSARDAALRIAHAHPNAPRPGWMGGIVVMVAFRAPRESRGARLLTRDQLGSRFAIMCYGGVVIHGVASFSEVRVRGAWLGIKARAILECVLLDDCDAEPISRSGVIFGLMFVVAMIAQLALIATFFFW